MAPPPQPPPSREGWPLDPYVWRACAGILTKIPSAGSHVYYFPEGHAEQASSPPDLSSIAGDRAYVPSCISDVRFLADRETDEVFSVICLDPRVHPFATPTGGSSESSLEDAEDGGVVSFAKILTTSDANNGGGFSVPRFCADSIFPPLDFEADPPVQTLRVRDVHGTLWNFRHIYRGTPRRHLLTTGWSKFVNNKKLIGGDSVVFIRDRAGELFVGIRRASRPTAAAAPNLDYAPLVETGNSFQDLGGNREGYWRKSNGRVPAESVVEAVRRAEMRLPFEVIYYPRAGSPDFVVGASTVEAAMSLRWTAGMRIRISMETEDSSRTTWFQGLVSGMVVRDSGLWPQSPWRMLQVVWDDSEVLQHLKSVCPWQVELVLATSQPDCRYAARKKLRSSQTRELFGDSEDNIFLAMTGTHNPMVENLSPTLKSSNPFPVGMQGARHDSVCSNLSNSDLNNYYHMYPNDLYANEMPQKPIDVPTVLNLWGGSENSSPQSQGSIHYYSRELSGTSTHNPSNKPGDGSIRLFGQIIKSKQHPGADVNKE